MLRLKNLTTSLTSLAQQNIRIAAFYQTPRFYFARSGGITSKAKARELEEEMERKEARRGVSKRESKETDEVDEETSLKQRELLEKFELPGFDKQLDKFIEEKMKEGKNEEDIISEFFGAAPKTGKVGNRKVRSRNIKGKDDEEYFVFPMDKTLKNLVQKPSPEEEEEQKRLLLEIENMENLSEILSETKEKPLNELSNAEILRKGNKLTKSEKAELDMKHAILQSQVLVSGKIPPPGAEPTLIVKDREVYEEIDLAKEREMEEAAKKGTNAMEEKREKETKLVPRETKEQAKIRLKVESSLIETKKKSDLEFVSEAKKDLFEANKELGIEIHEAQPGDSRLPHQKINNSAPTVYDRARKEATEVAKLSGLDYDYAKSIMKEYLFKLKKLDEENKKHQENTEKKLKRKKLTQLMEEISQMEKNKTFDFEDEEHEDDSYLRELSKKKFITAEDLEKVKDDDIYFTGEDVVSKEKDPYEIHKIRTKNNVEEYLHHLFNSNKQTIMQGVKLGRQIVLNEVILSQSLTVVNVFWAIVDKDMKPVSKDNEIVKKIQHNLNKFSGYARGKMCQDLGFKFAPELRFYYSEAMQTLEEVKENFASTAVDIVKSRMQDEIKKGAVKTNEDYKKKESLIEQEIEESYFGFLQNFTHEKLLKTKRDKIYNPDGTIKRNNRDADGRRKKYKRPNSGAKFWDSLSS